jgi:site-specific recombinase XerD
VTAAPPGQTGECPPLPEAIDSFREALIAKSPRTAINYVSALARFREFLPTTGCDPDAVRTDELPDDVLERFYAWLLKTRGRDRRTTAVAYTTAVRAFFRYLDRRRWLNPEQSYERIKDGLRELVGRLHYKTPRIDDAIAGVVTHVEALPVPSPTRRNAQQRLELLRDKAILQTLYGTALRRQELSRLNRTDVRDGRSSEGLVTGKGDKERTVFFDKESLSAIRAYLEARADAHLPLFIRHDDGRGKPGLRGERWRLSPQSVWLVVKKYGALAGVELTTHHLRHLKARVLLNAGAELAEVQDILGHASPDTTKKIYAQYTKQHLREAFDRYSLPAAEVARRARR